MSPKTKFREGVGTNFVRTGDNRFFSAIGTNEVRTLVRAVSPSGGATHELRSRWQRPLPGFGAEPRRAPAETKHSHINRHRDGSLVCRRPAW